MKLGFTADFYEDSGIRSIIDQLDGLSNYVNKKNKNNTDIEIFIVINCLPHELKMRKRFSKADRVLYYDIVLDYKAVKKKNLAGKRELISKMIIGSFDILDKYKLGIDKCKIVDSATAFFINTKWID